jgi:hypothetical protein
MGGKGRLRGLDKNFVQTTGAVPQPTDNSYYRSCRLAEVEWNTGLRGYGEEFLPITGLFQHPRLFTSTDRHNVPNDEGTWLGVLDRHHHRCERYPSVALPAPLRCSSCAILDNGCTSDNGLRRSLLDARALGSSNEGKNCAGRDGCGYSSYLGGSSGMCLRSGNPPNPI